jgi:hypothetical protein
MESQTIYTPDTTDILALIEKEEEMIISPEISPIMTDSLSQMEDIFTETIIKDPVIKDIHESLLARFRRVSTPKIQFVFYYLSISTIVFFILLGATNWNSYYTILSVYIQPQTLTNSKTDIMAALNKSRVIVYADNNTETPIKEEEKSDLKKKLAATNAAIKEDQFSVKQLVQEESKINVDLDITPYDNRIIIPKIGKNIPLVDVQLSSGFDFDHMENIFMQELEK